MGLTPEAARTPRRALRALGALALAVVPAACTSSSGRSAGAPVGLVKVKDFKIEAPKELRAGPVMLQVRNAGPDTHELILVRADGHALPLRKDNLTVDEDAVKSRTVGAVDNDQPGTQRFLEADLAPGRYVLFCNMSGHYMAGMHARLDVTR